MAASEISFPHPVLGNGDDITVGEISPSVSYQVSDEAIHLTVSQLTSGHPKIEQMLQNQDATWHIRVQCSRTYVRESYLTCDETFDIRLKGEDYEGWVDIGVSIVAAKDVVDYKPEGMHDDYGDETFGLRSGDVIGIGPDFRFLVDKVYDPLKAPVSSIVRITEGDHGDGPFTVTFDDDLIIVRLSRSDWNEYAGIRDRVPTIVHSAIILPTLAEAIRKISEHTDTLWSGRLKNLLEARNIDEGAPLPAAQELLGSPITRVFSDINATLDRVDT